MKSVIISEPEISFFNLFMSKYGHFMSEYVPKALGKVINYLLLFAIIGLCRMLDRVGFMVAKCACYRSKPSRQRLCNNAHTGEDEAGASATVYLI